MDELKFIINSLCPGILPGSQKRRTHLRTADNYTKNAASAYSFMPGSENKKVACL